MIASDSSHSSSESLMPIRGLNIAYKHIKTSKQPKYFILACHGWLDNLASFSSLSPLINDAEIICIDLFGHGLSDHRHVSSSYAFQEYILDIHEVIHHLKDTYNWPSVILMGHSMGAIISSLVASAVKHGELNLDIQKLILFDYFGTLNEPASFSSERIGIAINSYHKIKKMKDISYSSFEEGVQARLNKSDMRLADATIIMQRNLRQENVDDKTKWFWRFDKRLLQTSFIYYTEEQTKTIMQSIQCEILFFTGKQSVFYPSLNKRVENYQLNNLRYYQLEGGHYVHMEQKESVAKIINECLAKSCQ